MFSRLINFTKRRYKEKLILKKRLEFNNFIKSIIKKKFISKNNRNILIDGMWDNPYHFLRIFMMKFAMNETLGSNLIGIINSNTKKETINTLQSLGLKKIINTQENNIDKKYFLEARNLINKKKKLPFNYPEVFLKDDICKKNKNPIIDYKKFETLKMFAKSIYFLNFYQKVIKNDKIRCAVLSHQVTIRFSTLVWVLLKKKIPVYVMHYRNGHITARKFEKTEDLLTVKDDYLSYNNYKLLSKKKINYFLNLAKKYHKEVKRNKMGEFKFINVYKKKKYSNKSSFLQRKNLSKTNKNIFIYTNCWTDFPNCYGKQWYKNYIEWFKFTLKIASKNKNCNWIVKPHPAEKDYGTDITAKKILQEFLLNNPNIKNIKIDDDLSGHDTMNIADTIITTIGTGGIEMACSNVEVIYCGNSPYSKYKFGFFAKSKKIYKEIILNLHKTKIKKNKNQALFFYGSFLADNPKFLIYPYNNLSQILYLDIKNFSKKNYKKIFQEIGFLKKWLLSRKDGYNTFKNFYLN